MLLLEENQTAKNMKKKKWPENIINMAKPDLENLEIKNKIMDLL